MSGVLGTLGVLGVLGVSGVLGAAGASARGEAGVLGVLGALGTLGVSCGAGAGLFAGTLRGDVPFGRSLVAVDRPHPSPPTKFILPESF